MGVSGEESQVAKEPGDLTGTMGPKMEGNPEVQRPANRQIKSLTGLRFFAAIWVVLLHFATHQHSLSAPPALHSMLSHGQLGVALFFVLSGFVLGYTYLHKAREGKIDRPSFYVARFARIYPVFALCVVAFLPFAWRFTRAFHDFGESVSLMGQSLGVQIVLLQTWFPNLLYATNWNTPSWSISVEAFFYLSFPLLAGFFGRNTFRANLTWAFCLVLLLIAIRGAYAYWDPDQLRGADANVTKHFVAGLLFYNPIFRVIEFTLGIILVNEFLRKRDEIDQARPAGFTIGFLATLGAGAALWSFPHSTQTSIWSYAATVVCLSALIFFVAVERIPWLTSFLSSPALLLLGEASYSLYMLQRPVAEYMNWIGQKMGWGTVEGTLWYFWVFLLALTGISILTFYIVEMPMRKKIRAWFESARKKRILRSGP